MRMTRAAFVVVGTIVAGWAVACSGGSSSGGVAAQSCSKETDCPSGQGCKTESNDGYCAPLCKAASSCPTQQQCIGSTDAPKPECKEVGSHTGGNGVCDLYNGSYGPRTCSGGSASGTTGGPPASTGTASGSSGVGTSGRPARE